MKYQISPDIPHLGGLLHPHTVQPPRAQTRHWEGHQGTLSVLRVQEGGASQHRGRAIPLPNIGKEIFQFDDDTFNKLVASGKSDLEGIMVDVADYDVFRGQSLGDGEVLTHHFSLIERIHRVERTILNEGSQLYEVTSVLKEGIGQRELRERGENVTDCDNRGGVVVPEV